MKKIIILMICLLCVISTLFSCANKNEIVINYGGSYSNALILIMKEKKIAEKYFTNTTIKWTNMSSSTEIRDAVIANRVSFGGISAPSYMSALEKNIHLNSVCYAGDTPIKMYMRKDAMRDYNSLNANDKIAMVGLNTILHIAFLADAYETFGSVSQFDNSFIIMPHADGLALISSSKDLSAYITTFPTTYKADKNKDLVCVKNFTDTVKEYGIGSIVISSNNVTKEQEQLFILAMEEAQQFIVDNQDEAAEIMSSDWGIPKEEIVKVLNSMPPKIELPDYSKLENLLAEIGYLNEN